MLKNGRMEEWLDGRMCHWDNLTERHAVQRKRNQTEYLLLAKVLLIDNCIYTGGRQFRYLIMWAGLNLILFSTEETGVRRSNHFGFNGLYDSTHFHLKICHLTDKILYNFLTSITTAWSIYTLCGLICE